MKCTGLFLASALLLAGVSHASAAMLVFDNNNFTGEGTATSTLIGSDGTQFTFSAPGAQFENFSDFLYSGAINNTPIDLTFSQPLTSLSFNIGVAQTGNNTASLLLFNGTSPVEDINRFNVGQGAPFDARGLFTSAQISVTSDTTFPYAAEIGSITYSNSVSPVPLPPALPMFGAALLVLGAFGYRMKRREKNDTSMMAAA